LPVLNEYTPEEMEKVLNEYVKNDNFVSSSFQSNIFNDGITKTAEEKDIKMWLANPENYLEYIEKLSTYYYISNPSTFQLYDMTKVLPTLNYKILKTEDSSTDEKNTLAVKSTMKYVKYKSLVRDSISQLITSGTLCGLWVGSKKKPFLYIFDDLKYVFPAYIKENSWMLWLDLKWFDAMSVLERQNMFETLYPHVQESDYDAYRKDSTKVRYVELPQSMSVCLHTHKLFRNQRFGIPWATQSFFDILHKEKLKALEKSISNKVINSVAVLTIGSDEQEGKYDDAKLSPDKKRKMYGGVKSGLEKNQANGVTVIGIPHWAKIEFPDIKTDGLDPDKFESINDDLNSATSGVMNTINGTTNFSSAKLTLDIMYQKIGVILEQMEEEIFQKLLNWVLPNKEKDNYYVSFDKRSPITTKEKISILEKLNASFGGSLKAVLDELDGVDFEEYVAQTLYEQEVLKLPEKMQPYANAYTQTGSGTKEVIENPENVNTAKTQAIDANNMPSASD
jgi:hypothetical protein